ncbi:monocarboxylate transporter-like, partial [Tropilaelaps mercedesae]
MISLAISLAALGIALPYFGVTPRRMLILGALYGIGRGVLNNQLPVIISRHFDKHCTKAVGVQRAGVCLIGFAFSASIPALIDELGLRGTFLILSGVMLNAYLGAIFLTDPEGPFTPLYFNADKEPETSALLNNNRANGEVHQFHRASDNNNISNVKSISQLSVDHPPDYGRAQLESLNLWALSLISGPLNLNGPVPAIVS